jgi:hypothetical protein
MFLKVLLWDLCPASLFWPNGLCSPRGSVPHSYGILVPVKTDRWLQLETVIQDERIGELTPHY